MISFYREILSRKDLIRQLVVKDLKLRFRRPALGFFWAFLSPLLTALVFYLIFSVLLKVRIMESPFILYLMSAVFPWRFFQDSLVTSATSLVDNRNLLKESSFPQYLIPVSIVTANFIIFLPSLLIVITVAALVLKGISAYLLFLPIVLLVHIMLTFGLSLLVSLAYIKWRDIKYVLEAVLLLLFYLTPVFYSLELVKQTAPLPLFNLYLSNPLVGILQGYRVCILPGFPVSAGNALSLFAIPVVFSFLIMAAGLYYYRRNQKNINDYLHY